MIHQPACSAAARAALLHPLVLLIVGLVSWPAEWDGVHTVLEARDRPGRVPADREAHVRGLLRGDLGVTEEPEPPAAGTSTCRPDWPACPTGWIGFKEANVIRYLDDDFLQFELKPQVRRTLYGQPFVTNASACTTTRSRSRSPRGPSASPCWARRWTWAGA